MVERFEDLPIRTEPANLPAGLAPTYLTGQIPETMRPQALNDGFAINFEPGPVEIDIDIDPGSHDLPPDGPQDTNIGPHWP